MTPIHQVFCTHCSYGSSAIERRQGDSEDRVLGYSARASSFEDLAELRKQYRAIERYLYYYLPNKVPSERKLELTPQEAPRRLFFIPSAAGLQLAGQVSYRQWDVARRRPGSYFAHVLVADQAKAAPWSILDCLQLWDAAGWKLEDTDDIPFDLDAVDSVTEVLKDPITEVMPPRPPIDDNAFLSFLTTPANGDFDLANPELIPQRWRDMPPEQRCELFRTALKGYLEIASKARDSLVLVVEPEVAVFFFYGIARLLPSGPIRQQISFSTYETNPDRLITSLAAVRFDLGVEDEWDSRLDRFQRGFALNTYRQDQHTSLRKTDAMYGDTVLNCLLESCDWKQVNQTIAAYEDAKAKRVEDLEDLTRAKSVVHAILNPPLPITNFDDRSSQLVKDYVDASVRQKLAGPPRQEFLEAVVGSPPHLALVLRCAGCEGAVECAAMMEQLVKRLDPGQYADLLQSEYVASRYKEQALGDYIRKEKSLPPKCDHLWQQVRDWNSAETALLARVISQQKAHRIGRWLAASAPPLPQDAWLPVILCLFRAGRTDQEKLDLALSNLGKLDAGQQIRLFMLIGSEPGLPSSANGKLAGALARIMNSLHRHPEYINDGLLVLNNWKAILPREYVDRLLAWTQILTRVTKRAAREPDRHPWVSYVSGLLKPNQMDERDRFGMQLAPLVADALPRPDSLYDSGSSRRTFTAEDWTHCFQSVAKAGGLNESMLPEGLSGKMASYYDRGIWHKKELKGKRLSNSDRRFVILASSLAAGIILLIGGSLWVHSMLQNRWSRQANILAQETAAAQAADRLRQQQEEGEVHESVQQTVANEPELEKPEPEKPEPEKPEPEKPEPEKPEPEKPEPEKPEPEKPEPEKPEPAKTEPAKTESQASAGAAEKNASMPAVFAEPPDADVSHVLSSLKKGDSHVVTVARNVVDTDAVIRVGGLDVINDVINSKRMKLDDEKSGDPEDAPIDTNQVILQNSNNKTSLSYGALGHAGQLHELAYFSVDSSALELNMHIIGSDHAQILDLQKLLRFCVVEISKDKSFRVVALQPIQRKEYQLNGNGLATIFDKASSGHTLELPPGEGTSSLYLSGGCYRSEENRRFRFGEPDTTLDPATTWHVPKIAEHLGAQHANVVLRDYDNEYGALLEVQPTEADAKEIEDQIQQIAEFSKTIQDKLGASGMKEVFQKPNEGNLGKRDLSRSERKAYKDFFDASVSLSDVLGTTRPSSFTSSDSKAHEQAEWVREKLLPKVAEGEKKKKEELRRVRDTLKQMENPAEKLPYVAVRIYRLIKYRANDLAEERVVRIKLVWEPE